MMPEDFIAFKATLQLKEPPIAWSDGLKAMWYDAKGDWEASHNIAQNMHSKLGSWLHAYLHRKEGDRFNSGYWYRMAERTYPTITLEEELKVIVKDIIENKR